MREIHATLPLNNFGLPEAIYRPDMLPLSIDPSPNQTPNQTSASGPQEEADNFSSPTRGGLSQGFSAGDDSDTPLPLDGEIQDEDGNVIGPVDTSRALTKFVREIPGPYGLSRKVMNAAYLPLTYNEGFPQLPSGYPFWHQMEFEGDHEHRLFKHFLSQGAKGSRQLFRMLEDAAILETFTVKPTLQDLTEYFFLYYWPQRARAHDLFLTASKRTEREAIISEMQDSHFLKASMFLERVFRVLEEPDYIETLTPKALNELLKLLIQWQRISIGVSANGPSGAQSNGNGKDGNQSGMSFEMILRQVASRSNGTDSGSSKDGQAVAVRGTYGGSAQSPQDVARREFVETILANPDLAEMAQELIIRISNPNNPN